MGKSDKKVKRDRIDALRKRFEEFLEDDKKRKERNEFILGQLEKICSCKLFVAELEPKRVSIAQRDLREYHKFPCEESLPFRELASPPYQQASQPTRLIGSAQFFNEINEKYIVIPKTEYERRKTNDDYETRPTICNINDPHWKNKYEILNQLKTKEHQELNENNPVGQKTEKVSPELQLKNQYEIPVRDASDIPSVKDLNEKVDTCQKIHEYKTNEPTDVGNKNSHSQILQDLKPNRNAKSNYLDAEEILITDKNVFGDVDYQDKKQLTTDQRSNIPFTISRQNANGPDTWNIQARQESFQTFNHEQPNPERRNEPIHGSIQNVEYSQDNMNSMTSVESKSVNLKESEVPVSQEMQGTVNYPGGIGYTKDFMPQPHLVQWEGIDRNPEGYKDIGEYLAESQISSDVHIELSQPTAKLDITIHKDINVVNTEVDKIIALDTGTGNTNISTTNVVDMNVGDTNVCYGNKAEILNTTVAVLDSNVVKDLEVDQREIWETEAPTVNEQEGTQNTYDAYSQPNEVGEYYYEKVQDHTVPVEVNDFEETQQKYDPTFEQQYVYSTTDYQLGDQQYDNTQAYREEQYNPQAYEGYDQEYDNKEGYSNGYNQEEYSQYQQQSEPTPQAIEQHLDKEEGIADKLIEQTNTTKVPELPQSVEVETKSQNEKSK